MIRFVVIGASGFIGRRLTHELAQLAQAEVYSAARGPLAIPFAIPVLLGDLTRPGWTNQLPDADVVFFLAQSSGYREFPTTAADLFDVNVRAVFELLEWSRKSGVSRFVYTSSGNVYKRVPGLISEAGEIDPQGFYDATKVAAEVLIRQYTNYFEIRIARLFTVYGPGQARGLIPTIADRLRKSSAIELAQGHGLYLTPTYIDDCAVGLRQLGLFEGERLAIANLAGSELVSVADIAAMVARILDLPMKVEITNDEPVHLAGDSRWACDRLDWRPRTSLEEGVRRFLKEERLDLT